MGCKKVKACNSSTNNVIANRRKKTTDKILGKIKKTTTTAESEKPIALLTKKNKTDQPPKLKLRSTLFELSDLLSKLTEKQKTALREKRFDSFLSLNISRIPTRLELYLIEKFNTKNCTIKLETGKLYIDKEDINLS